jgi:hypothetical protein
VAEKGAKALYSWVEVAAWAADNGMGAPPDDRKRILAAANHLLSAAALLANDTEDLLRLVTA